MLGVIIGDIAGSRFEFNNHRSKDFDLFAKNCFITDDSIMTLAVAKAILESKGDWEQLAKNTVKQMHVWNLKTPFILKYDSMSMYKSQGFHSLPKLHQNNYNNPS